MLRRLLAQLRTPSFVIALTALVFSATGGAVAAKLIGGAQIRDGSIAERDLSSALRKKLVRGGPTGPQGAVGAPGTAGAQGPAGPAGSPDAPADVVAKLVQADGPGSGVDADTLDGLQASDLEQAGDARSLTFSGSAWLPGSASVTISDRSYSNSILRASGTLNQVVLAVLPLPLPSRIGARRLHIDGFTVCNRALTSDSEVTGTGFRLNRGDEGQTGQGAALTPAADIFLECPTLTVGGSGAPVDDGQFSELQLVGSMTATTAHMLTRVTVRYRYLPAP